MRSRLVSKRRDISLNDEMVPFSCKRFSCRPRKEQCTPATTKRLCSETAKLPSKWRARGAPGEITRGTALQIKRPRNVALHNRSRKPPEDTNLHKMKPIQKQIA